MRSKGRENDQNSTTRLVQIAKLYYQDNLAQQEIAKRIGVSRSLVAQQLIKAREQGIIKIEINDPTYNYRNLSVAIQKKTQLRNIEVIPNAHDSSQLTLSAVASRAAQYILKQLESPYVLGFAWGHSITEVVKILSVESNAYYSETHIIPLLGESINIDGYTQMNQLVLQVSSAIHAIPKFLLAPIVVGHPELRESLLKEKSVKEVADFWDRLDLICVGIGTVPPTPGLIPWVGLENVATLCERGAVGDIGGHYFDINGCFVETGFEERFIGISVKQMRKVQKVVAIAHGSKKAKAVCGAIRTGIISNLFIDRVCAEALLYQLNVTK